MSLTKAQAKRQFDRAKKLGWLPYFQEAAEITEGLYDMADLMAIGSRETNLDPKWLTKVGDRGNGFGLMQADRRSFPEFTKGDGWKDARTGILFGAKVLMQKQADYEKNVGKSVSVKSSKGGTYRYTGKLASGTTMQHIVISSYNCGRWSQYAYAKGQPIDKYSTGGDYGADVMQRAVHFRTFLSAASLPAQNVVTAETSESATPSPTPEQQTEPVVDSTPIKPIDKLNAAGDKLGEWQAVIEKFGFSVPDAKRRLGTWILMFLKSLSAPILVAVGVVTEHWELFLIAALLIVIVYLIWNRSGKRAADERAGIPPEVARKLAEK